VYIWVPSRREMIHVRPTIADMLTFSDPGNTLMNGLRQVGVDFKRFDSRREAEAWVNGIGLSDKVEWKEI